VALSWSESDTDTSRPFPYVTTPPPARWCYPGMDEALCEAIWRLRLTQSEKSAREVHDELVLEVAPGEREPLEALVRAEMGAAAELTVPLDVSVGTGRSWHEAAH